MMTSARVVESRPMTRRSSCLALLALLAPLTLAGCKKSAPENEQPKGKLATQLVGKWNDQDDGSLAFEFMSNGTCKAFGDVDCKYEITSETGSVLLLKYNAADSWDEVEVTFQDADKATWKDVTVAKTDPESAVTKLARTK